MPTRSSLRLSWSFVESDNDVIAGNAKRDGVR